MESAISPRRSILVYDNPEQLAEAAALQFINSAQAAISLQGRFSVAVAGGNTPKRVYELLASERYRGRIEWSSVHIFFGDERCVPPDHPDSNYRMVKESLLTHVPIPTVNVHRMRGEDDPTLSARLYEEELRAFFEAGAWPCFDLVLLGMGEDGHTASLFPGTAALREKKAWVVANWVEQLKTFRLTLTAAAICSAAYIVFLVTGEAKARRLHEVLSGPRDAERLPAQLIRPVNGSLEWLVDKAAASMSFSS
jgi:6-phosphogluconolactonase